MELERVKMTKEEFESVYSELNAYVADHEVNERKHSKDTCPICNFMSGLDTPTTKCMVSFFTKILLVVDPINALMQIATGDAESAADNVKLLSLILMLGIKIGRKQVQVEQLNSTNVTS